jgi:hypothetical protein
LLLRPLRSLVAADIVADMQAFTTAAFAEAGHTSQAEASEAGMSTATAEVTVATVMAEHTVMAEDTVMTATALCQTSSPV